MPQGNSTSSFGEDMTKLTECKHLSPLLEFDGNWIEFEKLLFSIFKHDFLENNTYFKGCIVHPRKHPVIKGRPESFFHLTHENSTLYKFNDPSLPDFDRCKRLRWVKEILEHYGCQDRCCSGIKYYNKNGRDHLLFEEERYLVVLEKRGNSYLLITAFYCQYDNALRKKLKDYNEYITKSAI